MATPPKEPTQFGPDAGGERQRMLEDFLRPTVAALRGRLTLRENLRSYVTPDPITFTPPDDWVRVTFSAGWANAGGIQQALQWRKTEEGRVLVRGRFTWPGGGAPANMQSIAKLPNGWAPPAREVFLCFASGGNALLAIDNDGVLRWSNAFANFTNISASGAVEFDAANRSVDAWASDFQVKLPQVPFRPELVLVHATDAAGQERVVQPRWRAATQGIVLERIPGLVPLTRYSLMVYALAG